MIHFVSLNFGQRVRTEHICLLSDSVERGEVKERIVRNINIQGVGRRNSNEREKGTLEK